MVSDLKTLTNKGCKIAACKKKGLFLGDFCNDQEVIKQGSGGIQQRSGGYTAGIRRLHNKDQEVMFSDAIIKPLQTTFAYKGCKINSQKKGFFFPQILPY